MNYIFKYCNRLFEALKTNLYYRFKFGKIGKRTVIKKTITIDSPQNIYLGNVFIGKNCWLAANPLTGASECKLTIMDGCSIGNYNHIYATGHIIIEKNVLTADKVYISDNLHCYEDINTPVKYQPVKQLRQVIIGQDSWLGENVCVIGSKIGKHCVIGANSVVTKDIPDYCVAVGAPAKIIKKFDFSVNRWVKSYE